MISQPSLERTFGPLTPIQTSNPVYFKMWIGAPIELRPCETGQISEATECNHCQFGCKVESDAMNLTGGSDENGDNHT